MNAMDELAKEHCLRIFRDGMGIHSEDALLLLLNNSRIEAYEKGETLFVAGEIMSDCAFIVSGSFFDYVRLDDGRCIVNCICGEYGDPAVPFSDLGDFGKPLNVTIEALEPLTVLTVPTEIMVGVISGYPEAAAAMARIVGKWNMVHSKMAMYNLFPIAKRYDAFKALYPDLFARLTQATIARLLNVSPAALSRALNNG